MNIRFTLEQKLQIIEEWLTTDIPRNAIARKHNVAVQTIRSWVKIFELHGADALKPRNQKRRKYVGEFRVKVVEDILNNEISINESCAKYNLNKALILHWKNNYLEKGKDYLLKDHRGNEKGSILKNIESDFKNIEYKDLNTELEKKLFNENQRLRAELEYSKKLQALIQGQQS